MPTLGRFLRHPLSIHLALWGFVNPFSLLAALFLAPSTEPETNVVRFSASSVVPLAMLLLWPMAALLVWTVFRLFKRRAPMGSVTRAFHLSQLPFLPFLLLAGLAFEGLEGNIIGFIIFPAVIVGLLITVPISLAILLGMAMRAARQGEREAVAQALAAQIADASSSQPPAE